MMSQPLKDILHLDDVKLMVDSFYDLVKTDYLLGPIFNSKIQDWDKHLSTMYTFWQSILLNEHTYQGAPFLKHISLPINSEHFDRWVMRFNENMDAHFKGENAENAKQRAKQFGLVFSAKMEHIQAQNHG